MKRLYRSVILEHFSKNRQMLFLMGPRQVGKTTTATLLEDDWNTVFYFNWDTESHRDLILSGAEAVGKQTNLDKLTETVPIVIFDEIHKYSKWKLFLKGLYDIYPNKVHILVTGSARLDVFQKGGDSLMGRYFFYRFHPLTVGELVKKEPYESEISDPKMLKENDFENLWTYGGFPDPFLKKDKRFFQRWKQLRFKQLIKEDLRDISQIQELGQLELLTKILPSQVGQLTSYSSLGQKVRASDKTVRRWIEILESLYYCFSIRPWSKNISRSLLKEPKYYLWDWSLLEDSGSRSENFIASHLLKAIHFWTDYGLGEYGLYFIRDKEKREVDFLVTRNGKPWFLVEAKYSDNKGISSSLVHFQKELQVPYAFQVVIDLPYVDKSCFVQSEPIIVPAKTFLSQLI